MAGFFLTRDSTGLLKKFDEAVIANGISTWERKTVAGSLFYTQRPVQWHQKAWFKAVPKPDRLAFYIVTANDIGTPWPIYAHYHHELLGTFLRHFRADFQLAQVTPDPTGSDNLR